MKLERLEESHRRGVRTMQLVHYTPNDIGDFQTGAVVHNGLTPFGADVIRACQRETCVSQNDVAVGSTVTQVSEEARIPSNPLHRGIDFVERPSLTGLCVGGESSRAEADDADVCPMKPR